MKKLTLAALVATSIMATSAFAEDPVQVVSFNGRIIHNIAGDASGISGANNGPVVDGAISVAENGSFTTTQSVVLEHRVRNTDTEELEDLVGLTTWDAPELRYYINDQEVQSSVLTLTSNGKPLATKAVGVPSISTPIVGTTQDDSKLVLTVTGAALSDLDELAAKVTPGINDVAVLATITAKDITP